MNKVVFFLLIFLLLSCIKDKPRNIITPEGNTTIHDDVLDKFAPARDGSYYIFKCKQTGEIDSLYIHSYFKTRDNTCNNDSIFPTYISYLIGSTLFDDISYFGMRITTDCENSYNTITTSKGWGITIYYDTINDYYCKSRNCAGRVDSLNTDFNKFYDLVYMRHTFGAYFCKDIGLCGFIAGDYEWELVRYNIK